MQHGAQAAHAASALLAGHARAQLPGAQQLAQRAGGYARKRGRDTPRACGARRCPEPRRVARGAAAAPPTARDLARGRGRPALRRTVRAARERVVEAARTAHSQLQVAQQRGHADDQQRLQALLHLWVEPARAGVRLDRSARCAGSPRRCRGRRRGRLRARPRALARIQRPSPSALPARRVGRAPQPPHSPAPGR